MTAGWTRWSTSARPTGCSRTRSPGRDRDHARPHRGLRRPARRGDPIAGRPPTSCPPSCPTTGRRWSRSPGSRGSCTGCRSRSTSPSRCPAVEGDGPGARGLAALHRVGAAVPGRGPGAGDRARPLRLADRVLQRSDPGCCGWSRPTRSSLSGEDTVAFWEAELDNAYRTGSVFAALAAHLWLGFVLWQRGDLRGGAAVAGAQGTEQNLGLERARASAQMYAEPFSVQIAARPGRRRTTPAGARRGPRHAAAWATASGCSSRPRPGCCSRRAGRRRRSRCSTSPSRRCRGPQPGLAAVAQPAGPVLHDARARPRRRCPGRRGAGAGRAAGAPRAWWAAPGWSAGEIGGPRGEAEPPRRSSTTSAQPAPARARPGAGGTRPAAGALRARARRGPRAAAARLDARRRLRRRRAVARGGRGRCAPRGRRTRRAGGRCLRLTSTERRIAAMTAAGLHERRDRAGAVRHHRHRHAIVGSVMRAARRRLTRRTSGTPSSSCDRAAPRPPALEGPPQVSAKSLPST